MGSSKASFGAMGLCAFMMAMMIMAGGVAGQGPAPAPTGGGCESVVLQLIDCLGYVMGSEATPPATCCSNLSAIIVSTPVCLCQLYNSSFTEPFGINITRAMMLPPACKLTTPDPSQCSLVGIPVPGTAFAPVSPGSAAPMSPESAIAPSAPPPPAAAPTLAPTTPVLPPGTAPGTGTQPGTNTSSPPPVPDSSFPLEARRIAVTSSLLFALTLLFY